MQVVLRLGTMVFHSIFRINFAGSLGYIRRVLSLSSFSAPSQSSMFSPRLDRNLSSRQEMLKCSPFCLKCPPIPRGSPTPSPHFSSARGKYHLPSRIFVMASYEWSCSRRSPLQLSPEASLAPDPWETCEFGGETQK